MDDPASRVPAQLLPHMHLVSRHRYPLMHMMPTDTVVEYLLSASKIVREAQPMHWTFLDGPQDGTVMLTWQPLNHLGTNFASDGYVWADVEQAFTFEARGYMVEMWLHRSGYHPPNESVAIHCRRRYRLLPTKVPNPSLPPPDPSLWIVHYSRAPPTEHIPANRIPVSPPVQNMLAQRRFLQSQGQLARKDFMLHDRNNWPTINFPPQIAPQALAQPAGPYPNAMVGRQPFYPQPGQPVPAPAAAAPAKAPRGHRASTAAMTAAAADFALEDEDVSTGDVMDLLTPREVSKMRYQQHHEWMEEIFASPYAISQITPVSLGLGRKGELETLTAGFFDAPVGPAGGDSKEGTEPTQATKMEPEKAKEFADRVAKKVADMTAEIEKLKKRHARRMEKFNRTSLLKDAELRLRDAAANPEDTGTEIWRMEGRSEMPTEGDGAEVVPVEHKAKYKVDDIVREVETSWRRKIVPEPKVSCVQKGGLLEKIEPEPVSTAADVDIDMGHTESILLGQFGAPAQGAAPAAQGQAVPTATGAAPAAPTAPLDAEMDMGDGQPPNTAVGETGDWVMVNEDNKKDDNMNKPPGDMQAGETPGSGLQGLTPGLGSAGDTGLDSANFDFTNMDSAGDALAAYTEQNEGLDLPDLDNSAFGDAFHASDNEHTHHHDADDMS
ncbi:SWI/SNF and RSC complexes subunit ssr4 [Aspergillus udagawae]|uniref:SWI/SNF and RSC complexes subunit ssr4 n=1 Tax=Aspergillus udagawae TaxID=91492 RepID=A0A8E0QMZ9_9EURO|nr:uncharacterized protein Aud_004671 [Aspergillus udagawae]GFF22626.1 SWI/SNF and RSC complexes subunit ssr4 [Aspergillus udagawae]GFF38649.1 SWI/SNF and RSC complexes subunit ssr4 [Aspergillus udagawae]GFF71942.1 SWI/SNF and RSC complexes subunit ssr4 [Aspergillus udagawae]GFG18334.1 SWI/SNF and RSC complexes subunit ssr4 [Aspergillus udagawae]GFG21604.1 SWI/SNF and RSC complexes subunit ssr4 [Aspergillus udagawae]